MKKVLVVCTGNLCRSPMAMVLLRQQLAQAGLDDQVQVESAGIHAPAGEAAAPLSRAVISERGLSLNGHQARQVTEAMLNQADLVIVMEEMHRTYLFHLSMRNLHKVYLLSELSGGSGEIRDPLIGTREDYRTTAQEIEDLLAAGMPRIVRQLRLKG